MQENLRSRCSALENQCKILAAKQGTVYNCQDKSNKNSSQLQKYLTQLENDERRLSIELEKAEWKRKCEALAAQARGLIKYLGITDTISTDTTKMNLSQLKKTFSDYKIAIRELQKRKHQKLRLEIEKKIHRTTSSFSIDDIAHVSSQTTSMATINVKRSVFDLAQHKELAIKRLDEISDIDFIAEYTKKIGEVANQTDFLVWQANVNRQIEQERLLTIYQKAKSELMEKMPLLPDGPNKNTLKIEIEKLATPSSWGSEYRAWSKNLEERKNAIATYIEKELDEGTKYQYLVDCLNEVLLSQGITPNSNLETAGGTIFMIGRFENYDNLGLSIMIDQENGEIHYQPTSLDEQPSSIEELSDFEKMMCPFVYSLADELEDKFGITNEFTIEIPPTDKTAIGISQKSRQQLVQEARVKQEQYFNGQQQRLQKMQKSIR
jgi:hypothetical protein